MNRSTDAQVLRYVGYTLFFALGLYLLYLVRGILPLFMVAALFAYAMDPVLKRLERRGYSRRGAIGFVFLVFLLLFVCLLGLLASAWQQVQALQGDLPRYQQKLTDVGRTGQGRLEDLRLPADVKKSINQGITDLQERVPTVVRERLTGLVTWVLSSVGFLIILLVVLPIITLWLMLEMNAIRARCLMLVPAQYRRDAIEISSSINELLGRYVRGQMIVCGLFGALCTTAFSILGMTYGMNYALVLGLAAGVLYIVPYVGMATLATAAGLSGYFTSDAPLLCALLAIGCPLAFNLVLDYGITPRILGEGLGLHPLMIIFALLSGSQVGGIVGMILAVPVAASLRVIAIYIFPQLSAPIPGLPPESAAPPGKATTSEVAQQTREAEDRVATPVAVENVVAGRARSSI